MNIGVEILNSSGNKLELLISGIEEIDHIAVAFEDGLRNHLTGVMVDRANSVRRSQNGGFILTCYPYYKGDRDRTSSSIRSELRFHLLHPVKTSP